MAWFGGAQPKPHHVEEEIGRDSHFHKSTAHPSMTLLAWDESRQETPGSWEQWWEQTVRKQAVS